MDANSYLMIAVIALLLLSLLSKRSDGDRLRLARLERKLDKILDRLGLDPNEGVNQEVADLLKAGQKIAAIKAYREQTGVGLKEAKDYVESL